MAKIFLLFSFVLSAFVATAQLDSLSKKDKALLDSMMATDAFLNMLDDSAKNYLDISVGLGNGTFSTQNQAVNATGYTNQLVITPAIFYYFKSGFNLGVTGFLTNDNGKLGLYQTGASVGYDYKGDKIATGVSYAHYFSDKNKYNNKSIYQNEAYGYFKYTQPYIEPGISLGFANGKFKQLDIYPYKFDSIPQPIIIRDSMDNKANYFSLSLLIEHTFYFKNLFNKNDDFSINSVFMLNSGSDKITTVHTSRYARLIKKFPKLINLQKKRNETTANKMQLQSIASSINLTYGIGKFYL
ncbi:MAG: hypothetical protein IPP48_14555 [Chitinophagaceae bacterium]|nr:hypothetical protein [Chitinophagaceae bacterium]